MIVCGPTRECSRHIRDSGWVTCVPPPSAGSGSDEPDTTTTTSSYQLEHSSS